MSSEPTITLFDLCSPVCKPQAWSPNTWKARIVLNYKRIPYKTVWLSYPDVEPTIIKLGGSPTATKVDDPSKPHYTLPAILDTAGTTPVMIVDSLAIAEYLDQKYPDRPVFPKQGKALEYAFQECFMSIVYPHVWPLMLPRTCACLDDRGKVYFRASREKWFGKKLEEFSPEGPTREGHWKALQGAWDRMAVILDKNGPGHDYAAGGSEPTRADFILASYLLWMRTIYPDEWGTRIKYWSDGRWERLLEKTKEFQAVP